MKPLKLSTHVLIGQILAGAIFLLGILSGVSQRTRPPRAPESHGPAQPGDTSQSPQSPQSPQPPHAPHAPLPQVPHPHQPGNPPQSPRPPQAPGPVRPPRGPRPPRSPYAPLPLRPRWSLWQPHFTRPPRAAYLGSVNIGQFGDHDVLRLPGSTPIFAAIQLQVQGGPVEIRRLVVRYADGSSEVLPINSLAGGDRPTPPVALSDPWRGVQTIEIWSGDLYGPQPYVTAYGLW